MNKAASGVCHGVIELLGDRNVPDRTFDLMRRLLPGRQIEIARIMLALNRYSEPLMLCLVATTPTAQIVGSQRCLYARAIPEEQLLNMEQEGSETDSQLLALESRYAARYLDLIITRGFVGQLLRSAAIVRYLAGNCPGVLSVFQQLDKRKFAPPQHDT